MEVNVIQLQKKKLKLSPVIFWNKIAIDATEFEEQELLQNILVKQDSQNFEMRCPLLTNLKISY